MKDSRLLWAIMACGLLPLASIAAEQPQPAVAGYATQPEYEAQVRDLTRSSYVHLRSLGRTLGGRSVDLLRVGSGDAETRPAVLVMGAVYPPQLVASELTVRLARRLAERASRDTATAALLTKWTFFFIPRPSPDACGAFVTRPSLERTTNERHPLPGAYPHPGGPADLNGDGLITQMRIEDPRGRYVPHPDDPRVLVLADAQRGEQGRYLLQIEGRGREEDGPFAVPPPPGVAFNRNFPFRYPHLQPGAGPNAVSEIETRAVADFVYDHPNLALVLVFGPEDNLFVPWKPDPANESKRIKTAVLSADVSEYARFGELYRKAIGRQDNPESESTAGSFLEWVYFHTGRWSLGCRGWWISATQRGAKPDSKAAASADSKSAAPAGKRDDHRGAEQIAALRWFAEQKLDGFVPWKELRHPDLPDRKVEVGGFKPFLRLNPPASELDALAARHDEFLQQLVKLLPRLELDARAEPLGAGLWRIQATITNRGRLPTSSRMGQITDRFPLVQAAVTLPPAAKLVQSIGRQTVRPLCGDGDQEQKTWLVLAPQGGELGVRTWCPPVGEAGKTLSLKQPKEAAR